MEIRINAVLFACCYLLQNGMAEASLEADFLTNRGIVTVVLDSEKTPMAVANLITLAEGTRSFREAANGAVHRARFYDGRVFDKVSNTVNVKLATVGRADLGYFFPDEFHPGLTHEPYILAMDNEGPNTNGGRIQFTGNVAIPDRDQRHTVFGKIPGTTSRQVIDEILSAEAGSTILLSVTIRRTDPQALAFDELNVGLPVVSGVEAPLQVRPRETVDLLFQQPAVSVLRTTSSTDLVGWTPGFLNFTALDDAPAAAFLRIDAASLPKAFYQISLVKYPEMPFAGGSSTFAGSILTVVSSGIGQLVYHFDETGLAGTYENILEAGQPPFFQGDFQVRNYAGSFFGPYSFQLLIYAEGLGNSPFNLLRGGYDSHSASASAGRSIISLFSEMMDPVFDDDGYFDLNE